MSPGLVLLVAIVLVAGCGGSEEAATPTSVPATPTEAPTPTPTEAPTPTPTEVLTPTPTNTPRPQAEVYFEWAAGGVRPADSDDVDAIVLDVTQHEAIVSGFGNEIGITIKYDPTLISVEELQDVLKRIGHPVEVVEK